MSALVGRPLWVFLDRDGTINVKPDAGAYISTPAEVRLLPGAGAAIRRLNEAGIWVGVITNQRGIALGVMTEEDLAAVHERLRELLLREGAHLDAIYVCPHHDGACSCRKPLPGLLLQAQRDLGGVDFSRAVVVGDSDTDVQAGRAVGAMTIRLTSHTDANGRAPDIGDGSANGTEATLAAAVSELLAPAAQPADHRGR